MKVKAHYNNITTFSSLQQVQQQVIEARDVLQRFFQSKRCEDPKVMFKDLRSMGACEDVRSRFLGDPGAVSRAGRPLIEKNSMLCSLADKGSD